MRVHIQPHISFEQYKAASMIVYAQTKQPVQRGWRYYIPLALICLTLGLALQYAPVRSTASVILVLLFVFWIVCKLLGRWSQNRQLRRVFTGTQSLMNDQAMTIDEAGIECSQRDGKSTTRYTWHAFLAYAENSDSFLMLPSGYNFVRIPKDAMTKAEQVQVRAWCSRIPFMASSEPTLPSNTSRPSR